MSIVPESAIFRDAVIDARHYSSDALQAFADIFAVDIADPDPDWPGEVGRYLAGERLRAIQTELERRQRVALSAGVPGPVDSRYQQWRRLAQVVRDRVDILDVFTAAGHPLNDAGPREAHAACVICGGCDRLVIRRDPPGRCWCRQCGWSADAVAVAMSLQQLEFRDAVRWLASLAGEGQVPV